jgi:hypothetical protein
MALRSEARPRSLPSSSFFSSVLRFSLSASTALQTGRRKVDQNMSTTKRTSKLPSPLPLSTAKAGRNNVNK